MAIFDLLGRRWAMGIIWNLSRGTATFRALQSSCETISPSILNSRLKELKEAQLIARSLNGYHLTAMGEELFTILKPFGLWALNWAQQISAEDSAKWDQCRQRMEQLETNIKEKTAP